MQGLELIRVLGREVVGRTEVLIDVVKLPLVLQEGASRLGFPRRLMHRVSQPAIMINAPVAEDLEVLSLVPVLRLSRVE